MPAAFPFPCASSSSYARSHPYETLGLLPVDEVGGFAAASSGAAPAFHSSTSTVTSGAIRAAYRRLALELHPDKARGLTGQDPDVLAWADAAFAALVEVNLRG